MKGIKARRENITDKMLDLLGSFKHLLIEIPLLSYLEDKAEKIQKLVSEMELPEFLFESFCEAP